MRRAALLAVVFAAILTVGCSRGPDDKALVTEIQSKLYADPQLKAANVSVTSKDGVVTLSGEVPTEGARYQAFKYATDTKGVTRVEDKLTLTTAQAPTPAPAPEPQQEPVIRRDLSPRRSTAAKSRPAPAEPPAPAPATTPSQAAPAAPAPTPAVPAVPEPPKPIEAEVPAGTELVIRMVDPIDTSINKVGERFRASLDAPITVDGKTVIPAGTDVTVEISEAKSAGRMAGRSELVVQAVSLDLQGKSYALSTDEHRQQGSSEGKNTATKVGVGAAAGAVIGAIAGGGKGAAIGAAVGAGGGTAVSAARKGEQIKVPSETRLSFTLQAPLNVTYLPERSRRGR